MPAIPRLLILDDDESFVDKLAETLAKWNYEVFRARSAQLARPILREKEIVVVLLGMNQSKDETMDDLRWVKADYPHVEVIVLAQRGHFGAAFKAMSLRAYDFLIKSPSMEELAPVIDQAYCRAGNQLRKKYLRGGPSSAGQAKDPQVEMVGQSSEIRQVINFIAKIGPTDSTVFTIAAEAPHSVTDHQCNDPEGILDTMCSAMSTIASNSAVLGGHCTVVLGVEHALTIAKHGWTRSDIRNYLWMNSGNAFRAISRDHRYGKVYNRNLPKWLKRDPDSRIPIVPMADNIHLFVMGGRAGRFSAFIPGWGHMSTPVLKAIDQTAASGDDGCVDGACAL